MKCVYKISCVDKEVKEFYIGSTDNLKDRISKHKDQYITSPKRKVYKFIREHGGLNNWEINPIKIYECEITKKELLWEERFYYDEYNPQLNCVRPIISDEETEQYRKDIEKKRPSRAKEHSDYLEKNREILNAKKREKIACKYCDKNISRSGMYKHIKRKHPTSSE